MSGQAVLPHAEPPARAQRARNVLLATVGLSVVVGLFFSGFSSEFGNPEPHNIPIAVVGTPSVRATLNASPALSVRSAADATIATRMVLDRTVYGAIEFTGPRSVELLVANGGGHSADVALTAIATAFAQSRGAKVQVVELAPTTPNDPNGTVEFYCIVFLVIGAALGANVLGQLLGPIRNLRDMGHRLIILLLYTSVAALTVTFLGDIVYGALVGQFGLLFLTLWAYTFSIAVAVAGVVALFGGAAGLLLTLTLVILGNTSAGGPVSRPLSGRFFSAINPYFPQGAGLSIVRGVQYFGGRGIAESVWCLATWTAGGLAFLTIHAVRVGRGQEDARDIGVTVNAASLNATAQSDDPAADDPAADDPAADDPAADDPTNEVDDAHVLVLHD